MKAFLGCLMCCALVISQTFARDPHIAPNGGPAYPGLTPTPSAPGVTGTWSGALLPTPRNEACGANSLGIFSLTVPTSGLSSGLFVMFAQGRVFSGTIQAAADPGKKKMRGILDASFNFTVHFACGTDQCPPDPVLGCAGSVGCDVDVTAAAKGSFDVDIANSSSNPFGVGTRLDGGASLHVDQGKVDPDTLEPITSCDLSLRLDGFKQSNG